MMVHLGGHGTILRSELQLSPKAKAHPRYALDSKGYLPINLSLVCLGPFLASIWIFTVSSGTLFEAWMNPSLSAHQRVLAAFRARFWLHHCYEHISALAKRFPDLYSTTRSFISPPSFHIFNRLCDTLVLLVLAFAEVYPSIPFCPWLCNTEFVEHFFGIARQLLPNFSYAEFLKMIQHIMVRQRILESGLLKSKRERDSGTGYIFDHGSDLRKSTLDPIPTACISRADIDEVAYDEAAHICTDILQMPTVSISDASKPLVLHSLGSAAGKKETNATSLPDDDPDSDDDGYESDYVPMEDHEDDAPDDAEDNVQQLSTRISDVDNRAALAAHDTARYSALSDDLETIVEEAKLPSQDTALPAPHDIPLPDEMPRSRPKMKSGIINSITGQVSIRLILNERETWQSGTTTKSERVVKIHAKYQLSRIDSGEADSQDPQSTDASRPKISIQEGTHVLRIAQELNPDLKKQEQQRVRQMRWQSAAQGLKQIIPLVSEG
jgi:hypothetical protein